MSDGGRIVLVSSTAGQRGEAHHADYAASKGAMISFVKSLAPELGARGITVNSVAPGWVDTEMCARAVRERRARAHRGGDSRRTDRRAARHRRPDRFSVLRSRPPHHRRDPECERRQRALRMIVLLFTGGTISMRHDPAAGGAVPTLRGRDILALAPGIDKIAPLEMDDWGAYPGTAHDRRADVGAAAAHHRPSRAARSRRRRRHARHRCARGDGVSHRALGAQREASRLHRRDAHVERSRMGRPGQSRGGGARRGEPGGEGRGRARRDVRSRLRRDST